jgi:hypothetical protein
VPYTEARLGESCSLVVRCNSTYKRCIAADVTAAAATSKLRWIFLRCCSASRADASNRIFQHCCADSWQFGRNGAGDVARGRECGSCYCAQLQAAPQQASHGALPLDSLPGAPQGGAGDGTAPTSIEGSRRAHFPILTQGVVTRNNFMARPWVHHGPMRGPCVCPS